MSKSVIAPELNELCPALMGRFIARGALPDFARLYSESEIFITNAGESPPRLGPWVQ